MHLSEKTIVHLFKTHQPISLNELRSNRNMMLDFWTLSCTNCPAALALMNEDAKQNRDVMYVACLLLKQDGVVLQDDIVEETLEQLDNLVHVYMTFAEKEEAKRTFSFSRVPFSIAVSNHGVVYSGPPLKKSQYEFTDDVFEVHS